MILAFSTSSPMSSVALLEADGSVRWSGSEWSPRSSGAACLGMLARIQSELDVTPADCELFVADLGPGSFTGVRVGVVLAKTFAYLYEREVGGLPAFDLICVDQEVAIPSRRDEFFVRHVDGTITKSDQRGEIVGYGGDGEQTYPMAASFAPLLARLSPCHPAAFLPQYLIEPSISQPKKPYELR